MPGFVRNAILKMIAAGIEEDAKTGKTPPAVVKVFKEYYFLALTRPGMGDYV